MPCKAVIAFLVVLIACLLSLQYSNAMLPRGGKKHSQSYSTPSSLIPGKGTEVQEPVQASSDDTDSILVGNTGFLKVTPRVGTTFDLPPVSSSESTPFTTSYHKKKERTAIQQSNRWDTLNEPVEKSSPAQSHPPERMPVHRRFPCQASEDDDHSKSTSRLQVPSFGNYRNTDVSSSRYSSMQTASNAGRHLSRIVGYEYITENRISFRCSICNGRPLHAYVDRDNQTVECSSCRSAYLITKDYLNQVKISRTDTSTVGYRTPSFVESDNDTDIKEPFELVQERHTNNTHHPKTPRMILSRRYPWHRYHHDQTSLFPNQPDYLSNNHPRPSVEYRRCIGCQRLIEQVQHEAEEQVIPCTRCRRLYFVTVDSDGKTNVIEVEGSAEDSPLYLSLDELSLSQGDEVKEWIKEIFAISQQIQRERDEHRQRMMQLNALLLDGGNNLREQGEPWQGVSQPVDFFTRGTPECVVCLTKVDASDCYKYCVYHCICAVCLKEYIKTEIMNNKNEIKCPDFICKTKIELHHIKSLVKGDKVYKILERRIKEQKAQKDPSLYICTAPDCGNILRKPCISNNQTSFFKLRKM